MFGDLPAFKGAVVSTWKDIDADLLDLVDSLNRGPSNNINHIKRDIQKRLRRDFLSRMRTLLTRFEVNAKIYLNGL